MNSLIPMISCALISTCATFAAEQPPNVVLIFADDLGYGDLGCYGATKVQTPNIDRLAAEGRRFTDAHSVSAVCTPSRYALLTGQYPLRASGGRGVWGPAPITSPLIVETEKTTIADVFKRSGYHTAVIGKWHLGFKAGANTWQEPLRPGPQDLGFDYYFGMPVVNSAPPYVYVENDRVVGGDPTDPLVHLGRNAQDATPITPIPPEAAQRSPNVFGGAKRAHELFNDYQVGTTLATKSVEWIQKRKENPFFLYLATTNIHHPFTPAKRFQGTSQCGLYGDSIHELDWIVGEILSCLEDNGLSDNTLVIFTSDNGGMFNHGGQAAFQAGHRINGALLGFKFGVWEGGHRVPMIVRWPGKVKAGTTSNQLIGNVDLLATFAALTGQKLDKAERADSVNMLPALVDEPEKQLRDHLVLAPHRGTHLSVRKGKWMYIPARGSGGFTGQNPGDHTFAGPPAVSFVGSVNSDIENGRIKEDAPHAQLYDLEADVNETQNVINEHPKVVRELSTLLASYAPSAPSENKKPRASGQRAKKTAALPSPRSASFDFECDSSLLLFSEKEAEVNNSSVTAREHHVASPAEIAAARRKALPGDTLVMADGVWMDADILFEGRGNRDAPITLRAATPGQVVLSGTSQLRIAGINLVVDGLRFENGHQSHERIVSEKYGLSLEPVVEFLKEWAPGKWTMNCRLTNCAFIGYNPPDPKTIYSWVQIDGVRNRVDHCHFSGRNHLGRVVAVHGTIGESPGFHQIDHNYFGEQARKTMATVGIGTGGEGLKIMRTVVELNLFHRANGGQFITAKASENTYRYNTFLECQGTLTLRHGTRSVVEGNYFLGNGVAGTGGIRVIDDYHIIANNYFAGLRGRGLGAALCFHNGVSVYVRAGTISEELGGKTQVNKALIAFNTFVDNTENILFGQFAGPTMPMAPDNCVFANNIVSGTASPLIKVLDEPTNTTWQGNIFYGADLGIAKPEGVTIVDPQLVRGEHGLLRPDATSPAIGGAEGDYPFAVEDVDGQPRGKPKDIGCDQRSTQPALRRPLTPRDVGPNWAVVTDQ